MTLLARNYLRSFILLLVIREKDATGNVNKETKRLVVSAPPSAFFVYDLVLFIVSCRIVFRVLSMFVKRNR